MVSKRNWIAVGYVLAGVALGIGGTTVMSQTSPPAPAPSLKECLGQIDESTFPHRVGSGDEVVMVWRKPEELRGAVLRGKSVKPARVCGPSRTCVGVLDYDQWEHLTRVRLAIPAEGAEVEIVGRPGDNGCEIVWSHWVEF